LTGRLQGIGLDARGQVPIHLIRRSALLGQICHGPTCNGEATFVLLDDWLPPRAGVRLAAGAAALALARRYLRAHAPAGFDDFATWSGLPVALAKPAWRALGETGEVEEFDVAGRRCLLPVDQLSEAAEPTMDVRLLPAYDDYLLGYRDRTLSVAAQDERRVRPGGGQIRPTVIVDGHACATWSRRAAVRSVAVAVDPFGDLSEEVSAGIAAEKADIAAFLGTAEA
jgi:hypothetical protein